MLSGHGEVDQLNNSPNLLITKHLQGREREWAEIINKPEPLNLLDLPVDVLQAIIREVTHTNDLTSLALTHSALHALVIPHIYSRFDIVWPDAAPTSDSRDGVDALTYGLATLVMAQDVFGEKPLATQLGVCQTCGARNFCQHRASAPRPRKIRRGNYFAQYTRKFSIGNGPEDWVKEYLITKEAGKMLGTLVACAVARMIQLESFFWDLPTGLVRDVWLALASLGDRDDGQECRLKRVWVRWHDNQDTWIPPSLAVGPSIPAPQPSNVPRLISHDLSSSSSFQIPPYPTVQFPTLSVLPALESVSVLDIDELSYVEELAVLVERSLSKLRELRVGLAHHAQGLPWTKPKEDRNLLPTGSMPTGEQRKGGLLGILASRFCSAFSDAPLEAKQPNNTFLSSGYDRSKPQTAREEDDGDVNFDQNDMNQLGNLLSLQHLEDEDPPSRFDHDNVFNHESPTAFSSSALPKRNPDLFNGSCECMPHPKLMLQTLELERVSLSTQVMSHAFDWSHLTALTLLGCRNHEALWKSLRKQFTPFSRARASSISKQSTPVGNSTLFGRSSLSKLNQPTQDPDYKLRITRLHTDTVSPALLTFIKESLAPDTLEYLFLQQSPMYKSSVTIDQIYRHAVRRHRTSLRKLLIDPHARNVDESPVSNRTKWTVNRELITCLTSNRMQLRELSIGCNYCDWHYLLQRLSTAQRLRSLHITYIANYTHGRLDTKEAALQVLDILALKPELELSYLGIQGQCFEIVEYQDDGKVPAAFLSHGYGDNAVQPPTSDEDDSDDHEDEELQIHDNESDDLDLATDHEDLYETDDETHQSGPKSALRLREILFYDDKVTIFNARHGKL